MEIEPERSHGSLKRSVRITDGPVMPHPSSGTGKKILVDYASVVYDLVKSDWVVKGWSGLVISGRVLKKDGTPGKENWSGNVHYSWHRMPEYAWLDRLIDAMRPEGSVDLPFRLTYIEPDELEGSA
jgi:hypothetical protein